MKYTKGPWEAHYMGGQPQKWQIGRYKNPTKIIAEVFDKEKNRGLNPGEDEINAHLIAAAPDMYELIKDIKLALEFKGMRKPKNWMGRINKALAKAEGEVKK